MKLARLVDLLDRTLMLEKFPHDASNNGLQVEAKSDVHRIAFGVDACTALFDAAGERGADMVFVHHGLSWGGEPRRFTGIAGERLKMLFNNGISLYAVHLPLDAHPELGNNARLADIVRLGEREPFFEYDGTNIGWVGKLSKSLSVAELAAIYEDKLDTKGKIYGDRERIARKVAIVSGGGGRDSLLEAARIGADLLITGEFDHSMFHLERELEFPVISLGHYASETVGVQAVAHFIAEKTSLECEFIDIPTGL